MLGQPFCYADVLKQMLGQPFCYADILKQIVFLSFIEADLLFQAFFDADAFTQMQQILIKVVIGDPKATKHPFFLRECSIWKTLGNLKFAY